MRAFRFVCNLCFAAIALLLAMGTAFAVTPVPSNPVDTARYGMIWTEIGGMLGIAPLALDGVTEDFTSVEKVYLNGGLDPNGKKLAPGYYYVTLTADLAGLIKIKTSYPAKPVFVTGQGVFQFPIKLLGTDGLFPTLTLRYNTYYYVWISKNPFGSPPCYPELDRARFRIVTQGIVTVYKFWDLSREGNWDNGEPPLENWEIQVFDEDNNLVDSKFTNDSGYVTFNLAPGRTYTIKEVAQPDWHPTTPDSITITIPDEGGLYTEYFGNIMFET